MYTPSHFREDRDAVLHGLMRDNPLATFCFTPRDGETVVNHLPLILVANGEQHGVLRGHVPRVNPNWLITHLNELTDLQEAARTAPWKVSDAPEQFTDALLQGLVGVEIPITSLVGKWKASQNRSLEDRTGVAEGLRRQGDPNSLAMAALVLGN